MGSENGNEVNENVALIFGVTGLVGRELVNRLLTEKTRWRIYGVARKPEICSMTKNMYNFISCDLLNASETKQSLSPLRDIVSHVFWVTWSSEYPLDSDECCVQNKTMLMGSSTRTLYNFMGSICVYGAICKYLNLPFVFGGTRACWEESYIDGSDSNLVAEQHIFAASSGRVLEKGETFNAINGVGFTWKEIWPNIGRKLGVQVNETTIFDEGFWFGKVMGEGKHVWGEIVIKEKLVRTEIEDLANWVFLDVLFRFPVKLLGKRKKVDRFGFKRKYRTLDSILYWIDVMRDEKLIPL